MPTYSYRCDACGFEFERVQRMTEDPIKQCPECHAERAQRQISSGNFILKGSGWYSDLYSGSSNKRGGGSSASSTSTPTAGTSSTATESSASAATTSSSTPASPSSGSAASASVTAPAK